MSKIAKILGISKPKIPALPKVPVQTDVGVPKDIKERLRRRSGVASTILTRQNNDKLGGGGTGLGGG